MSLNLERKQGQYGSERDGFRVNKEAYEKSDLFIKVTHTPKNVSGQTYLTFKNPKEQQKNYYFYDTSPLEGVQVYFSTLCDVPILLGLCLGRYKYYKFDYTGDKSRKKLSNGFESVKLTDELIYENDRINGFITYRLDKKTNDASYKVDKISVVEQSSDKYGKYIHTAVDLNGKKNLLLYNDNLLELKENDEFEGDKIGDIRKKSFSIVKVFYNKSSGENLQSENAIFLELTENTTSEQRENTSISKNYFLQRMDEKGKIWKQIKEKPEDILGEDEKTKNVIQQISYSIKNSLMVELTKKSEYPMRTVKNYQDDGIGLEFEGSKKVKVDEQTLSSSNYKFYKHSFSESSNESVSKDIVGIKIYEQKFEIKFYDSQSKKKDFCYYPQNDSTKTVDIYIYQRDTLPLMLSYDNKWYRPNKDDYFKWTEVTGITSSDNTNIKNKLDEKNNEFNQINLSSTDIQAYGISLTDGKRPEGFDTNRINVSKEEKGKYLKVSHSTKNNSFIGKVMYDTLELENESGKMISEAVKSEQSSKTYNNVCAYYHISDKTYKFLLLISFNTGTSIEPDSSVFYERVDITRTSKWKKIEQQHISTFQNEDILAEKINRTNYLIKRSIKIQLEKQDNEYSLETVKNKNPESLCRSDIKISVTNESKCLNQSGYICYKHSIPPFTDPIKSEEIGGLRLFIFDRELPTHSNQGNEKLPIYYDDAKKYVFVYYHDKKVPLLVEYNNKFYKPNGNDDYFNKWVPETISSCSPESIIPKLNEINKSLNQVNLSHVTTGNYGIPRPHPHITSLDESFCDRISAKLCKNAYYRKATHLTMNKFSIGNIVYNGKSELGFDIGPNDCEVLVYFQSCDNYFLRPLIISIGSQDSPDSRKWYHRSNDGKTWTRDNESTKYDNVSKLQDQLNNILSNLFVFVPIKIEQTRINYTSSVTNGHYPNPKKYDSQLSVNTIGSTGAIDVTDYRCYGHRLTTYYEANITKIKSELGILETINPSLYLLAHIAENRITLFDKNKRPAILTFSKGGVYDLDVYFSKKDDEPYVLPLLIKYENIFFSPKDKDSYFKRWDELVIENSQKHTELKKHLDKICKEFNEIHLLQTSPYGIPYCGNSYYYQKDKFTTKRVLVTKHSNPTHFMCSHSLVNKSNIQTIKPIGNSQFNKHSQELTGQDINVISVIFKLNEMSNPLLILLNEKTNIGGFTTYGYYYKENSLSPEYNFKHVKSGCILISKFKGESEEEDDEEEESALEPIKQLIREISETKMNEQQTDQDRDTSSCREQSDRESDVEQCQDKIEHLTDSGSKPDHQGQGDAVDNAIDGGAPGDGDQLTEVQSHPNLPPTSSDPVPDQGIHSEDLEDSKSTSEVHPIAPQTPSKDVQKPVTSQNGKEVDPETTSSRSPSQVDGGDSTRSEGLPKSTIPDVTNGKSVVSSTGSNGNGQGTTEDSTENAITKFFEENKVPVSAGGGGVAAVAGSIYPIYKLVLRCRK